MNQPTDKPLNILGKPSIFASVKTLGGLNVLIADADHRLALVVKNVLFGLGFRHVHIVHDGPEALALLKDKDQTIDLIISDLELRSMSGLELTQHLRTSEASPSRATPIIMLTGYNDRDHVEQARDAGVNEYVLKPFSSKALLERVYSLIERPKSFVLCKSYVGPDRRRRSSLSLPASPDNKRRYVERRPPLVVGQAELANIALDDTPRMLMPDYALLKKVGLAPQESPQTAAASKAQDDFMEWMLRDVKELEDACQMLTSNPEQPALFLEHIRLVAYSIQSRAGMFGYSRAAEIARALHDFAKTRFAAGNAHHLAIVQKHVEAVSLIFNQNLKDSGGMIGETLAKDLQALVEKAE